MNPDSERIIELFTEAMAKPSPAERAAFLDAACRHTPELRAQVEALLKIEPASRGFLQSPPPGTPAVPAEKPGDRIGRYKLLEKIGEGGCGVVYLTEQEEPVRRRVALKILKLGMDSRAVIARFEAERQALALMDHPNIAKIFDAGVTGPVEARLSDRKSEVGDGGAQPQISDLNSPIRAGRPYFVMELVRGVKITEFCEQHRLSIRQRLDLFIQVCQAIQHAHQKGIIHRDLKPSNVLVSLHDTVPVPKVIDFGIAKATTDQRLTDKTVFTAFQQFLGTPAYMSPEQAKLSDLDVDTRSDIYSLGVLLYELLTGKTPFDGKELLAAGLDEMRRIIREVEPVKPSTRLTQELNAKGRMGEKEKGGSEPTPPTASPIPLFSSAPFPSDLDWITMKCLEKDRRRRYETANGLARDVERYLNSEPVVARPPSRLYRFQKLVQRNRLAFTAGAAIAVVLVAGVVASTWQAIRATRAEREQARLRQMAETKEHKSEQIARFLKAMLEGVGPSKALGRDTTMLREILGQTAGRVAQELAGQPEIAGELFNTLGEVAFQIDDFAQAEAWLTKAVALRTEVFGATNAAVANSLDALALALYGQGKYAEAEQTNRLALALQRETLGPTHTNVATSLNNLGITLTVLGRADEALAAYAEALTIRTNLFGEEHPEVAVTLNTMAQAYFGLGKLRECEAAQRRALEIQRQVLPDPHPDLALSLNNFANFLQTLGKLDQAEPLYRDNARMQRVLLGENAVDLSSTFNNHGFLLEKMGRWSDAEAAHLRALTIRTNTFTNDHLLVAYSLQNLAGLRTSQGDLPQATELFQQALAMRRRLLGETNADVAASISGIARVLRLQGRHDGSEAMQNDALAIRRRLPSAGEHLSIAVSLTELGLLRRAQGRPVDAEKFLREAHDRRAKVLRNDDSTLAESAEHLALVLCDLGQFGEAEKLARQAVAIREQNYPDDWRTFHAQAIVGAALLGQKNYAAAEPLLLAGCQGMEQRLTRIPFEGKPRYREALQRLVQLYETTNRPAEAAEWRQKLEAITHLKP